MSMLTRLVAIAGAITLACSQMAIAQSTIPNMLGYWDVIETSGATYGGTSWDEPIATIEIEITDQTGHAFVGHFRWSSQTSDQATLHDGTQLTNQAEEEIVGVFTGSGGSFVIAEHPDTGYMFGQMLDDNRLEIIAVESGPHAFAARNVYERRQ